MMCIVGLPDYRLLHGGCQVLARADCFTKQGLFDDALGLDDSCILQSRVGCGEDRGHCPRHLPYQFMSAEACRFIPYFSQPFNVAALGRALFDTEGGVCNYP